VASFRENEYGWRAEVFRCGVRRSQSGFRTKAAAVAWAGVVEAEIMGGARGEIPNLTVSALLERYDREVSARKKGAKWESVRLRGMAADRLGQVRLRALDTPHLSDWQQRRLQAVSEASVRRERNLLNNVFQVAVREWRWLRQNPLTGIRRPRDGRPRRRIASPAELAALKAAASPRMRRVIVFAVETGMRAGEIAGLTEVRGRVAYIADSKNNEPREVPLSRAALAVWQGPFGTTSGSISALFARLCDICNIVGLTFHDLRRTALVRLSTKLTPFELAKMFGHKDMRISLNVYYGYDAKKVAEKL